MAVLYVIDENGNEIPIPSIKGDSGVYVGSGDFPEGYNIKIDPNGEADDLVTKTEFEEAISEQNKNLGGLRFGVDGDGNYGYYGADDSLIPFKSNPVVKYGMASHSQGGYVQFTITCDYGYEFKEIPTIKYALVGSHMTFNSYEATTTSVTFTITHTKGNDTCTATIYWLAEGN